MGESKSISIQGWQGLILQGTLYVLECEKIVYCCVLAEISTGLHVNCQSRGNDALASDVSRSVCRSSKVFSTSASSKLTSGGLEIGFEKAW